ncbi:hypothetical protein L1887_10300 [Cichorium endivia]|nr:hypothetical protein L1887_10300 [Cichorium endivia]
MPPLAIELDYFNSPSIFMILFAGPAFAHDIEDLEHPIFEIKQKNFHAGRLYRIIRPAEHLSGIAVFGFEDGISMSETQYSVVSPLSDRRADLCSSNPESCEDLYDMDSSTALYNQLKGAQPFFVLAGPNVIESEEHILHMAKQIKAVTSKLGLPLVFKSSFDKANRTSSKSFRGPGLAEGLKILEKVKATYDLPIVTDVHESSQCEAVGRVADIIQIPAFLCRQTDLLVAAAKTGKIVNIKKGQFCAPSVMTNSAEKVRLAGNQNVMVCERGTMFGYNDLIVDPRNFEWMREANCPVVADVTHALQQPAGKKLEGGGVASGGLRELIPCVARTAVAVGVDGLFMEVHDDPLNAPVDGPTQWPLRHLEELLEELVAIARVTKGKKKYEIDLTPFRE